MKAIIMVKQVRHSDDAHTLYCITINQNYSNFVTLPGLPAIFHSWVRAETADILFCEAEIHNGSSQYVADESVSYNTGSAIQTDWIVNNQVMPYALSRKNL